MLVSGLFALSLLGGPAVAGAPDASEPPRTSGPLVGLSLPCEDNGPAGPNEFKGQACSWSYELLPAETNTGEDFSAYWVQMEIDPGPECARMLMYRMEVPTGARIVSTVPDKGGRVKPSSPATTELVVDGEGAAPVPGTVAQDVAPTSGRVIVRSDERSFSYVWVGNSRDKVTVAVGVQVAHEASIGEWFSGAWSEGVGMGGGSCAGSSFIRPHRGHGRPRHSSS